MKILSATTPDYRYQSKRYNDPRLEVSIQTLQRPQIAGINPNVTTTPDYRYQSKRYNDPRLQVSIQTLQRPQITGINPNVTTTPDYRYQSKRSFSGLGIGQLNVLCLLTAVLPSSFLSFRFIQLHFPNVLLIMMMMMMKLMIIIIIITATSASTAFFWFAVTPTWSTQLITKQRRKNRNTLEAN